MSALGQKRTPALQKGMTALLPIATKKADITIAACLLYLRKRTCAVQEAMSAFELCGLLDWWRRGAHDACTI
jgi:hypothetical protein